MNDARELDSANLPNRRLLARVKPSGHSLEFGRFLGISIALVCGLVHVSVFDAGPSLEEGEV